MNFRHLNKIYWRINHLFFFSLEFTKMVIITVMYTSVNLSCLKSLAFPFCLLNCTMLLAASSIYTRTFELLPTHGTSLTFIFCARTLYVTGPLCWISTGRHEKPSADCGAWRGSTSPLQNSSSSPTNRQSIALVRVIDSCFFGLQP